MVTGFVIIANGGIRNIRRIILGHSNEYSISLQMGMNENNSAQMDKVMLTDFD